MICPSCSAEAPEAFKFCGNCGAPLATRKVAKSLDDGERRQLTVLFCDLADSTKLAEQLDPEEFRELVTEYQGACVGPVSRYGGHVAQYLGDGLLIYFGFPRAHEDDARRAVHAGLAILEELTEISRRIEATHGVKIAARIGAHTGEVVAGAVGAGERKEQLALGRTPNVAARLQAFADVGTMVISEETRKLVAGVFELEPLGEREFKGVRHPVATYRVLSESVTRSRFDVTIAHGLSPLVGREAELSRLEAGLERSRRGVAQVIVVSGEGGIGKSRLVHELQERSAAGWRNLTAQCSPYHEFSALYPILEMIRSLLGLDRTDTDERRAALLKEALETRGLDTPRLGPILARLLSLPWPGGPATSSSPFKQKAENEAAILDLLLSDPQSRPLFFLVEDLHWVDPSTMDLLGALVRSAAKQALFLVLTSRPTTDLAARLADLDGAETIELERLSPEAVDQLVQGIANASALSRDESAILIDRTDGVPLWVEEMTHAVVEAKRYQEASGNSGSLPESLIPTSLQDSLTARLDQLPAGKGVAQVASVLGRQFRQNVVASMWTLEPDQLESGMQQLLEAGLVLVDGDAESYIFRHALVQDSAYASLLKSARREYHGRAADILASRPSGIATAPEVLAHHYTEGGRLVEAVQAWQQAGEVALVRCALVESIQHLSRGLELLERLPEGPEKTHRELGLQLALGSAHGSSTGFATPGAEKAYHRAHEICRAIGEAPNLFWVIRGLWTFYQTRGELGQCAILGEQLERMARASDDYEATVYANYCRGVSAAFRGEFDQARHHLRAVRALERPGWDWSSIALQGIGDPIAAGSSVLANVELICGDVATARDMIRDSVVRAERSGHDINIVFCSYFEAWFELQCGDFEAASRAAKKTIDQSLERGIFFHFLGNLFLGATIELRRALSGDAREDIDGIEMISRGLEAHLASGGRISQSLYRTLWADALVARGRGEEALPILELAETLADEMQEGFWKADIVRARGSVFLASALDPTASPEQRGAAVRESERLLREALDHADAIGAASHGVRAAAELARALRERGARDEARDVLEEALGSPKLVGSTPEIERHRALLMEL